MQYLAIEFELKSGVLPLWFGEAFDTWRVSRVKGKVHVSVAPDVFNELRRDLRKVIEGKLGLVFSTDERSNRFYATTRTIMSKIAKIAKMATISKAMQIEGCCTFPTLSETEQLSTLVHRAS